MGWMNASVYGPACAVVVLKLLVGEEAIARIGTQRVLSCLICVGLFAMSVMRGAARAMTKHVLRACVFGHVPPSPLF